MISNFMRKSLSLTRKTNRLSPSLSLDESVLRGRQTFSSDGGLRVFDGNLGRAVIKISAVTPEYRESARRHDISCAEELEAAYCAGEFT
jgi:phosphogluconate dehydratase